MLGTAGLARALVSEGTRFGPMRAPRVSFVVFLALVALAILLLPARPLARPRRQAVAFLALSIALLGAHLWHRRDWAQASRLLVSDTSRRGAESSTPIAVSLARLASVPDVSAIAGHSHRLALDAFGYLTAPETGAYNCALECPETCRAWLDGRQVAAVPEHARSTVPLVSGIHPLRLELRQIADGARVAWQCERSVSVEWLGASWGVSDTPVSAGDFLAAERRAQARLLLFALGWSSAGVLFVNLIQATLGRTRWRDTLLETLRTTLRDHVRRDAMCACILTVVLVTGLRWGFAISPRERSYAQEWTSEHLMQSVSAADLRDEPFRSLFYLHIQPPALDALRALIASFSPNLGGDALVRWVDTGLYWAWALVCGALVALAFVWLSALAGRTAALVGAALVALHPATIFYATYLDTTLASAAGVLWLTYELWRFSRGTGSPTRLSLSASVLFLTRSVVQWPFAVVLPVALWCVGCDWRRALRTALPFALVVALLLLKQYVLFGLTVTSSFGPFNACRALSGWCLGWQPVPAPALPSPASARVLRRVNKLDGSQNYNHVDFVRRTASQMAEYRQLLAMTTPTQFLAAVGRNFDVWLIPSSRFWPHRIVDKLPWRKLFDAFSGGWRLLALVALAGVWSIWRERPRRVGMRRALGLALPCAYVVAVSLVFEFKENVRYKFFVEPVLWVFILAQAWNAGRHLLLSGLLARLLRRRTPSHSQPIERDA